MWYWFRFFYVFLKVEIKKEDRSVSGCVCIVLFYEELCLFVMLVSVENFVFVDLMMLLNFVVMIYLLLNCGYRFIDNFLRNREKF